MTDDTPTVDDPLDDGDDPFTPEQEPPAYTPAQFGAPSYADIDTHEDLIQYSKGYLAVVIAHYDMDIDAGHIADWDVSTRAKRRAAAVETPDLSALGVQTVGLARPDWDAIREDHNDRVQRNMDGVTDVKDVRVILTWGAFEAFDEEEWRETLRHEAIHIEQYHRYGQTDHSITFTSRATDLATTDGCPQFEDYTYPFECRDCGGPAGGRYRESKAVKFARLSKAEQEEWADSDTYWTTECCGAFVTLRDE